MTAAIEALDRTGRTLRIAIVAAVVYLGFIVTVASAVGVVNSFRAADYARQALAQAQENGDLAALIRSCVTATPPGETPTQCVRDLQARNQEAMAEIVARLERIERAVR